MRRWLVTFASFALSLPLASVSTPARAQTSVPAAPATKPSAADEAAAKRQFENGLKLYGEGAYDAARIAFETSYKLGGRAVALKNVAQAHRSAKHFVEAYEAYEALLERHGAQLSPQDRAAVRQALDELSILSGTLLLQGAPEGATVRLDGTVIGTTPLTRPKRVSVAAHVVRVEKAGFEPFEATVNVASQEAKTVDVLLAPEKTAAHVAVREQSGKDVHVIVDGTDEGAAPWEGDVAAGEHTIAVRSPRFASEPRVAKLAPKERLDLVLDATPVFGRLRVTTLPASANISIDGRPVGTGAWEGELTEGAHRIEVVAANAPPQVREVTVARGELVVQEVPVASAIGGHVAPVYDGLYGRLSAAAGFAPGGIPSNAVPPTTRHDSSFLIMPTGVLRVGRAWGFLAAEVVGAFAFEHRDESLTSQSGTQTRHPRVESNGGNVVVGAGPRVTSKDDTLRFTAAVAPGVAIRNFGAATRPQTGSDGGSGSGQTFAQPTETHDQEFGTAGYTTFALMADAGILLGSTPGTKLFVGVHAWLDFAPKDVVVGPDAANNLGAYVRPGRGVVIASGPQLVVGPSLGVQFGH